MNNNSKTGTVSDNINLSDKRRIYVIILAAGMGNRMGAGSGIKKQYRLLNGIPMFMYSLRLFLNYNINNNIRDNIHNKYNNFEQTYQTHYSYEDIDGIFLVVPREDISDVKECIRNNLESNIKERLSKVRVIAGGAERYESSYLGIKAILDELDICNIMEIMDCPSPIVLIHDSARPLLTETLIDRLIEGACEYRACIPVIPLKDTIKKIDKAGYVVESPERASLFSVQTPQAFELPLIYSSYISLMRENENQDGMLENGRPSGKMSLNISVTDDAMVAERFGGVRVGTVAGEERNLKVTTEEDLKIAEMFMNSI